MSTVEGAQLEVVQEEEPLSKEEIENQLIAVGVNACYRSYDSRHKELRESFLALPLKDIAKSWDLLESNIKVAIIDENVEDFKKFIMGS
tara:strand:+ start:13602 stop:13868 length:267 start_codon:yes stop_codon:yes gene_type:complete